MIPLHIAITNRKGGVGKTLHSVSLASYLAGQGYRVVLVDTDPQGNVAKWFNLPEDGGIFDLLVKERPIGSLLRLVPQEQWWPEPTDGTLAILPGNASTTTAGIVLAFERAPDDTLKQALGALRRSDIDFVVMDTSPTVTPLVSNVYVAADVAILPANVEVLALNGVVKTQEAMHAEDITRARLGKPLEILGVLPNKFQLRYIEHREQLKELRRLFGDLVWPPVGRYITFEKAPSFGQSVFAYAPKHKAAQVAAEVGQRVLEALQAREVV